MSGFRQLMMKSKVKYIDLSINGSLTVNNGIVSGFSSSNYLITADKLVLNQNTDFEFVFTFKTADSLTSSYYSLLKSTPSTTQLYIDYRDDRMRFRTVNNENSNDTQTLWYTFTADTTYKIKWKYTASTDKHNYGLVLNDSTVKTGSATVVIMDYDTKLLIGSEAIKELNLKNSSIKIGNTQYKLRIV